MVINNVKKDIRHKMVDIDWSTTDLGEALGISTRCVQSTIKHAERPIRKSLVRMFEELGYDIRLEYVERKVE